MDQNIGKVSLVWFYLISLLTFDGKTVFIPLLYLYCMWLMGLRKAALPCPKGWARQWPVETHLYVNNPIQNKGVET